MPFVFDVLSADSVFALFDFDSFAFDPLAFDPLAFDSLAFEGLGFDDLLLVLDSRFVAVTMTSGTLDGRDFFSRAQS